jgi:putative cardiolipin synthase
MKNTVLYFIVFVLLIFGGCATLKHAPPAPYVNSMPSAPSGLLSEVTSSFTEAHAPGQSGFLTLSNSAEAFKWRLALVDQATQSIDIQYFIWQNDETGVLLFDRLLKAADRGVRVRLLVDDFVFAPKDHSVAAITRHPNFDLKIFNPGNVRNSMFGLSSTVDFLFNLKELNRRMHNKLFVVDNHLAIVGGRNIGNEYFGLGKKYNFRDLDVLAVGPVVPELSDAFDIFWNAELSYPGSAMSDDATIEDLNAMRKRREAYLTQKSHVLASYPLEPRKWEEEFQQLPDKLLPGEAHFIQDKPVLIGEETIRLDDMLKSISNPSQKELLIVSPYFIPSEELLEQIAEQTAKGMKIAIITASLGSNNHTAAHSHYKKYRRKLLEIGAQLFEVKHDLPEEVRKISDVPPGHPDFTCLHIKMLVGDRDRCFVGSLNIDPRAIELNTENGLYIESPELCGQLAAQIDTLMLPENSWRVYLDENDRMKWESSSGTVSRQPARHFGQRISDFFLRLLPIESQI